MAEDKEFPFDEFKGLLSTFIKDNFRTCPSFIEDIETAQNNKDLKRVFINYCDEVCEHLGGDNPNDLRDEVCDLENEVDKLEYKVSDLEDEIDELKLTNLGTSLNDEYKREFIREYYDNYTPWELEHLLKNGRKFLNENPLP
jgi:hypothetical protein